MAMPIDPKSDFVRRHVGPGKGEMKEMLEFLGYSDMEGLIQDTVPESIRLGRDLELPPATPEHLLLRELRGIADKNEVYRSYIGMGYYDTVTPGVIGRNILENPGWYTQYTPYQAEISQGRLEALLNFQTMVIDMTGLEIANASLLDEGTAAAEAMALFQGEAKGDRSTFFVSELCHPQTIAVVQTRAKPVGIQVVVGDHNSFEFTDDVFGALVSYPTTCGQVLDYEGFVSRAHDVGAFVVVAADLMSLALLKPPGEFGADAAVGNTQRFGVPMGYGGPHAAYLAAHENFKRKMPGRIIGVSVDADGNPALRMALQTREQHIRREKATSNICTAQVLLAIMAGMYAVYHGPEGIKGIALRIHILAGLLAEGLKRLGHELVHENYYDTVRIRPNGMTADEVMRAALDRRINLRDFGDGTIGIAMDEGVLASDVNDLFAVFGGDGTVSAEELATEQFPVEAAHKAFARTTPYLTHPVFNSYHSETEMLRYIHKLEARDLSLNTSMISLGSCTMKLNATTEMVPVTWSEFANLHPFAPADQAKGYKRIIGDLERWLEEITGFAATSMMPNSGANGEYTGLLVIRAYHEDRGESHRNICLVPASAHGTNPASAVMAGMKVVVVKTDDLGNIDVDDLRAKAEEHAENLAATMVTYPSTHGVFESRIREVCDIIHENGGMVYLDGANLNAQVGLARPGEYGADVLHFNLHKTFAIPHGGGGPGMGPISCTETLAPYLPNHPVIQVGGEKGTGPVSAAPWGSASILPISWAYIRLLGFDGVRSATEGAILNANYLGSKLEEHFPILYHGEKGRVAHEFILDLRPLRKTSGVTDEDVAKRLMDFGFHSPTQSFPVAGTLMVEPTESESKYELDRFCAAMATIRAEIAEVEDGKADPENNLLKNAPHTSAMIAEANWDHPYSRERAVFPAPWTKDSKFWPPVRRVNNAYGDRNLVCACLPVDAYSEE
ncbi:MAG: aminomethyl-transferring glycine dehydrogenase [Gemmatimonadetes bacterium]|nr:aminomethyl-transferring glycine dehydrogenase [Gemmatimonadota bacterium]NNM03650.1 aminomethyl-transferring glycine dehydrogenase [Gemmatimonadota bacterium]